MRLHIANKNYSSWSLRPWVLMQHLGIAFEEKLYSFHGDTWDELKALSPNSRVPMLEADGIKVWDSLAIVEYLADRFPGVWPEDKEARIFARCTAAEMHSGFSELRNLCPMNCALRIDVKDWTPALLWDWARIDQIWSEGLSRFGGPFLAGAAFTAADAFFAPVAFRAQTYSPALSAASSAYVDRILALPTMQDWYQAALKEPWKEAHHEEEAAAAGVIRQDFRVSA
ncbi:glutathione S-transferase [Roseibium litorale]|uniref:Glutathione S-transferase n=1 Tax=Roseibium litorale TaxID=2803841 RepID=A0ABR9CQI5_9HYPH|nr:glutathione S-transferase [Roseibium litorale]MBD8892919.1 glutathione S-transferase [Roseibium litorale]